MTLKKHPISSIIKLYFERTIHQKTGTGKHDVNCKIIKTNNLGILEINGQKRRRKNLNSI
jgi:hypothetical protein